MSEYGYADALMDLARGVGLDTAPYDRLTAYIARMEAAEKRAQELKAERDVLLAEHEAYKHILDTDGALKHCEAHIHARKVLRGE